MSNKEQTSTAEKFSEEVSPSKLQSSSPRSHKMSSPETGPGTPIEADSSPYHTSDSINSDSSVEAPGSVFDFLQENGRTYHSYRAGIYPFPNDAPETDRLDNQHIMTKYAFSGRNYFAPLKSPQRIFDIGTGTGLWAIEMGDEFPDAEVQATDLSPIQPSAVPQNVHFFIDDASEKNWCVPPGHFDYIHARNLHGCFEDFKEIIERAFFYTKPGGYMESQEVMSKVYCDDGTMPADWPFVEWSKYIDDGALGAGRPLRIANKLKKWYEEVGFVDVEERIFKVPLNPWAKDERLRTLGLMSEENVLNGLSGFSMAYFTRVLGWSKNELEVYLVNVRKAVSDRNVHAYHKLYVVWGRKPLEGARS